MESANDQCRKEGCAGCWNCNTTYHTLSLELFSTGELENEISTRKLKAQKEMQRQAINSPILEEITRLETALKKQIEILKNKLV